jgi:hypothetical protein
MGKDRDGGDALLVFSVMVRCSVTMALVFESNDEFSLHVQECTSAEAAGT